MILTLITTATVSEGTIASLLCCDQNRDPNCEDAKKIKDLEEQVAILKKSIATVEREMPGLVEYVAGLEEQRDEIRQKIEDNAVELKTVMWEQDQIHSIEEENSRRAKVVGRVSLFMENILLVDDHSELNQSIDQAEMEVDRLEGLLDRSNVEERMESILNRIGRQMTEWAETLELEHMNVPYRLDLRRLAVVADQEDRPISMDRMGSGKN